MAWLNSTGGANWVMSASMSAPSALCISLATLVSSKISMSWSTGSSMWTGRRTAMADTWLVAVPPSGRVETGHMISSGLSRSSPWLSR
jgi:hypothetical protein